MHKQAHPKHSAICLQVLPWACLLTTCPVVDDGGARGRERASPVLESIKQVEIVVVGEFVILWKVIGLCF